MTASSSVVKLEVETVQAALSSRTVVEPWRIVVSYLSACWSSLDGVLLKF